MSLKQRFDAFTDLILHYSIFRGKAGQINFYGINENEGASTNSDGIIIVQDDRTKRMRAFRYRLENRHLLRMAISYRVWSIQQHINNDNMMRLLAVLEDGQAHTPYGHYDRIPRLYQQVIEAEAAIPVLSDQELEALLAEPSIPSDIVPA
jgi:hypothetical protein